MNTRSASARSFGTVVRATRSVASMAVANPLPTAELLSITANPAALFTNRPAVAPSQCSAVASLLPSWCKLRAAIETPQTRLSLATRSFSRGPLLILNFSGALKALRSLSSNALVQHPQKSGRGVFHALCLSPVRFPSCAAHVEQRAPKEILNVGNEVRKFGNV